MEDGENTETEATSETLDELGIAHSAECEQHGEQALTSLSFDGFGADRVPMKTLACGCRSELD